MTPLALLLTTLVTTVVLMIRSNSLWQSPRVVETPTPRFSPAAHRQAGTILPGGTVLPPELQLGPAPAYGIKGGSPVRGEAAVDEGRLRRGVKPNFVLMNVDDTGYGDYGGGPGDVT